MNICIIRKIKNNNFDYYKKILKMTYKKYNKHLSQDNNFSKQNEVYNHVLA